MLVNEYLKMLPGLYLGKICLNLSRYSPFGGSTLPGRLALSLSPRILSELAAQLKEGCILITGTNGKTTTARLLASILSRAGKKIIHNSSGANLISGVTTPFVAESSWMGKMDAELGVLEVDEASMPAIASCLKVKAALVTNLFMDQADRLGGVEHTLGLITRGLERIDKEGLLFLNADDPLVASIQKDISTIYYGIDDPREALPGPVTAFKICHRCGKRFNYSHLHFAHLGLYRCSGCGAGRPLPHYSIASYRKKPGESTEIAIKTPAGLFPVSSKIPGFYNLYNVLAAVSCALALDVGEEVIKTSLRQFATGLGRMETLFIGEKAVELGLIKNPAGANEILRTLVAEDGQITLMLALNDKYADGLDVSWLWEVDFEMLVSSGKKIGKIVCSGSRGEELSLRLKYAGFDTRLIQDEKDLKKAVWESLGHTPAGGKLQVLLTYTAMQELRKIIGKMVACKGLGRQKACAG